MELLQSLVTGRLAGPHQGEETTRDVATAAALVRYSGFLTRVQELTGRKNISDSSRKKKLINAAVFYNNDAKFRIKQGARKNEFNQNAKTFTFKDFIYF